LLDAIKQVPSYAKFLKDLCTVKRKLNVKKKAFLAEQVSAILQNNNALKYKDPGCPTISCFIREHKIKRALLDLGACVNLLPYSVFHSLNLGELKPTSVTLLLADRSVKVPRGIVEDVLVQVDKFIYPVDFVVLNTQPVEACNSISVILGHLFLATSNALINCRNGLMKLSFGNMTLEMNIFNICKQPEDDNDLQEVDFIEKLVMINFKPLPVKLRLMNLTICKWSIFRKNQRHVIGDHKLKNCHHDQLSPYLQVFNHQNLI
jgi:hypothetical protein